MRKREIIRHNNRSVKMLCQTIQESRTLNDKGKAAMTEMAGLIVGVHDNAGLLIPVHEDGSMCPDVFRLALAYETAFSQIAKV